MLRRAWTSVRQDITADKLKAFAKLGRYHNQIGTKLLFWPCAWGVALGISSPFAIPTIAATSALFFFGAFNLRSAGCGVNDYFDRDFDKSVERTKVRPLASGELTTTDAKKFIFAHLTGGLITLAFMKGIAIKQSLAIFPLAMAYPLAKRYTDFAQVVLGLCFNSGIFIGFAQASGSAAMMPLLPFYLAGICWTLMYDTVYALQDRKDDMKLGLKGLAVRWGDRTISYAKKLNVLMLLSMLTGGAMFDLNAIYYAGSFVHFIMYNRWLEEVKFKDQSSFQKFFMNNSKSGWIIFLLILVGRIGSDNSLQTREAKDSDSKDERRR